MKRLFSALLLLACEKSEPVDLLCGGHSVIGGIRGDVAELKIDGMRRILPLQGVFTDEPAAKYAPGYLSAPQFAMTVKNYVGITQFDKKVDFAVFSRKGKTEYYEFEMEGEEKSQCK
ncbi:MAG: hypothetical protein LBB08_01105 [Rickettsiales bacterium]|jgi:hypothetical protein|nr:hypothetical protein [Rickettsiales bacterium]